MTPGLWQSERTAERKALQPNAETTKAGAEQEFKFCTPALVI